MKYRTKIGGVEYEAPDEVNFEAVPEEGRGLDGQRLARVIVRLEELLEAKEEEEARAWEMYRGLDRSFEGLERRLKGAEAKIDSFGEEIDALARSAAQD